MIRRIVPVLAAVVVLGACGGGGDDGVATKVESSLVPPTLADGALTLREDKTAHKAFANVGGQSLVDDGRLWAVRDGDQLVATLQMATLDSKVRFSAPGAYRLRAIASDGQTFSTYDVDVTVK